ELSAHVRLEQLAGPAEARQERRRSSRGEALRGGDEIVDQAHVANRPDVPELDKREVARDAAQIGRASCRERGSKAAAVLSSSRRRHTRLQGDWSSDVCSSDLELSAHVRLEQLAGPAEARQERRRSSRGEALRGGDEIVDQAHVANRPDVPELDKREVARDAA